MMESSLLVTQTTWPTTDLLPFVKFMKDTTMSQ